MDNAQVIERFDRIERSIEETARACQDGGGAPEGLVQRLQALRQRAHEAREQLAGQDGTAEDPARVFECVDGVKQLGDEVSQAADEDDAVPAPVRQRLSDLRNEIANFRRQLHGRENRREERPAHRSVH